MAFMDAYVDGWHAHRLDLSVDDNPYHVRLQFTSHNRWVSGWCKRFEAVKHGQPLELDDE